MLENLKKYKVYLGSKSPRRRELLQQLQVPFEIRLKDGIEEVCPPGTPAIETAQCIADVKADAYARDLRDDELVITADTVVVCDGKVYGKPKDKADAERMLAALAGKTHQVATGVTIVTKDKRTSFNTVTDVTFAPLTPEEIHYYVEEFTPLDKAGAYGIQEWIGCVAVKGIDGSFYNVMGLPVHRLYQELKKF